MHAIHEHERLVGLGYNVTNVTIPYVPTEKYIYIFTGNIQYMCYPGIKPTDTYSALMI